jgi:F420-dependent oxidoreductase-like protein
MDVMKLALHLNSYSWPGGAAELGSTLERVAVAAEQAGFAQLSATDHVWQTSAVGDETDPMLETYSVLSFVAGHTSRIELVPLVSAAISRAPGFLAKTVTTLDVLSGGRAWLGLGAGWNDEEAVGLGLPSGPLGERFAHLEETIKVCLQMWSGSTEPFDGALYQLGSTLNSPMPLSSPRPRILIGGAGEHRTLRLAAQYADACNVFGGPDAGHKLGMLRRHCDQVGRDYDSIVKTAIMPFETRKGYPAVVERIRTLHDLGFSIVHGALPKVTDVERIESFGSEVIAEVSTW